MVKGSIPRELEEEFREKAMEKFGYGKGALSSALEEAILKWLSEEEDADEDAALNNKAYRRLKGELQEEYQGRYVCIADGELHAVCDSLEDAYDRVGEKRHAIVYKVGEEPREEVRLGWRVERKLPGPTNP